MEKSGIFSLIKVSEKESDILLSYLRNQNQTPAFDFICYLIGIDYIQFLDLLAGTNLKIPSRKSLYRDIEYVKIYSYIKERDFTVDSVKNAAKIYNKNISFVKRAIFKVSKTLNQNLPVNLED
jgi:hypothetical protein